MSRYALLLGALAGCATAAREQPNVQVDANVSIDGPDVVIDAPPPIDAPPTPMAVMLSQTTSPATIKDNSLACFNGVQTRDANYYRVFDLAEHGVTRELQVESVTFGVDTAQSGSGNAQAATLKLGTYNGTPGNTLALANIVPVTSMPVNIPNGATTMTVPIPATIPATAKLVVELEVPDAGHTFFIGSNTNGESKPGYLRTTACQIPTPTSANQLAQGADPPATMHIVMSVSGTY